MASRPHSIARWGSKTSDVGFEPALSRASFDVKIPPRRVQDTPLIDTCINRKLRRDCFCARAAKTRCQRSFREDDASEAVAGQDVGMGQAWVKLMVAVNLVLCDCNIFVRFVSGDECTGSSP